MQPLHFIANYYGEKMAFYYAWLLFYTSWLMIPAIPGIALFIYQMILLIRQYRNNEPYSVDNPWNCLYCLVMAVWSTVCVEVWKRRENEIAHMWNMKEQEKSEENELSSFKWDLVIDKEQKCVRKRNLADSYARRLTGELPTVLFGIGIVVGLFVGY